MNHFRCVTKTKLEKLHAVVDVICFFVLTWSGFEGTYTGYAACIMAASGAVAILKHNWIEEPG